MPIKLIHKEQSGWFLTDAEISDLQDKQQNFQTDIKLLREELESKETDIEFLRKEVEIAQGESKYKLKKLASIIERKDKLIATLQGSGGGDNAK